jgi:hypothetical protein
MLGGSSGLGGAGGSFLGATSGTTNTGRTGSQSVGSTTFLGPYFGNPLSLGIAGTNGTLPSSPTFGTPLISVTGLTGGSGTSSYGGLAGAGGSAAGSAITSTGTVNATSFGVRRAPQYTTTLGFEPPLRAPTRVQTDVQQFISRSERLPSRNNIRVEVEGPLVVLRGSVADEHERRLAEALARLTPGVHDLRNELAVRTASAAPAP